MKSADINKRMIGAVAGLVAATAGYFLFARPRHLRGGASGSEIREFLPGDDLIPDLGTSATHGLTIVAPPEDVWPWLAQLGQDKAGFYSYTPLENLFGSDMKNTYSVIPEWQRLKVGDVVQFHPELPPVPVVDMKEGEYMVLGADLEGPNATTWTFVLRDLGHGFTRFVVRLRGRTHQGLARVADLAFGEPAHFIMERKMMLTVKKLAEQRAQSSRN